MGRNAHAINIFLQIIQLLDNVSSFPHIASIGFLKILLIYDTNTKFWRIVE